jgi:hypothetical protein
MVGSDWPLSTLATSVAWFDVVVDAVAGLSPVEREAVLTGIACAVDRVVPHAVQLTRPRRGGGAASVPPRRRCQADSSRRKKAR